MSKRGPIGRTIMLLWIAAAVLSPAVAEDIEKKFRIGLSIGGFNPQDEIRSDSANILTLVDEEQTPKEQYLDPRNDAAVFNNLDINADVIATITGQYAFSKMFLVEASVGYQTANVGEAEVQIEFVDFDCDRTFKDFCFEIFRVQVGEIERVPLQLTALARFRPRASFNPYAGLGIGYTFIGFEPTPEFNELSVNMDSSIGGLASVTDALIGNPTVNNPSLADITDLTGATVDARDTFEWHLAGGMELSLKRKWALVLDVRYTVSSRSLRVGFNGGDNLGIPVPQLTDFQMSDVGDAAREGGFGPILIRDGDGGLGDFGAFVDDLTGEVCPVDDPAGCTFVIGSPDGVRDGGYSYAQGGGVDYGGFSLQIGFRYAF